MSSGVVVCLADICHNHLQQQVCSHLSVQTLDVAKRTIVEFFRVVHASAPSTVCGVLFLPSNSFLTFLPASSPSPLQFFNEILETPIHDHNCDDHFEDWLRTICEAVFTGHNLAKKFFPNLAQLQVVVIALHDNALFEPKDLQSYVTNSSKSTGLANQGFYLSENVAVHILLANHTSSPTVLAPNPHPGSIWDILPPLKACPSESTLTDKMTFLRQLCHRHCGGLFVYTTIASISLFLHSILRGNFLDQPQFYLTSAVHHIRHLVQAYPPLPSTSSDQSNPKITTTNNASNPKRIKKPKHHHAQVSQQEAHIRIISLSTRPVSNFTGIPLASTHILMSQQCLCDAPDDPVPPMCANLSRLSQTINSSGTVAVCSVNSTLFGILVPNTQTPLPSRTPTPPTRLASTFVLHLIQTTCEPSWLTALVSAPLSSTSNTNTNTNNQQPEPEQSTPKVKLAEHEHDALQIDETLFVSQGVFDQDELEHLKGEVERVSQLLVECSGDNDGDTSHSSSYETLASLLIQHCNSIRELARVMFVPSSVNVLHQVFEKRRNELALTAETQTKDIHKQLKLFEMLIRALKKTPITTPLSLAL
eukprot:c9771_g1_i1.p1 GENE.c9771_g1_i1~~c9771_g1_i1.p1  ORF type:complete len:590 (+),score=94.12 c9771_g1_i1:26-1795(+)